MKNTKDTAAEGTWVPLMEYSISKALSLSTLRRHIKAEKVIYKTEKGRYLIWDSDPTASAGTDSDLQFRLQGLLSDLQKAQEEIAELKTLIAFYEEGTPHSQSSDL